MHYSLVNLEGKTLDTFRSEAPARDALRATVEADPSLVGEVLLLSNTDSGEQAGSTLVFEDLFPAKIVLQNPPVTASVAASGVLEMISSAAGYVIDASPRLLGREAVTWSPHDWRSQDVPATPSA